MLVIKHTVVSATERDGLDVSVSVERFPSQGRCALSVLEPTGVWTPEVGSGKSTTGRGLNMIKGFGSQRVTAHLSSYRKATVPGGCCRRGGKGPGHSGKHNG